MNGSIRSAHSNAYFYGFGRTKVIVLFDTLLAKLSQKEITSVVCHELGHWAYNHIFTKLLIYLLEVLSIFYIFSFFLQNDEVYLSFGVKEKSVSSFLI
jgi:STE24 endopeptidase